MIVANNLRVTGVEAAPCWLTAFCHRICQSRTILVTWTELLEKHLFDFLLLIFVQTNSLDNHCCKL